MLTTSAVSFSFPNLPHEKKPPSLEKPSKNIKPDLRGDGILILPSEIFPPFKRLRIGISPKQYEEIKSSNLKAFIEYYSKIKPKMKENDIQTIRNYLTGKITNISALGQWGFTEKHEVPLLTRALILSPMIASSSNSSRSAKSPQNQQGPKIAKTSDEFLSQTLERIKKKVTLAPGQNREELFGLAAPGKSGKLSEEEFLMFFTESRVFKDEKNLIDFKGYLALYGKGMFESLNYLATKHPNLLNKILLNNPESMNAIGEVIMIDAFKTEAPYLNLSSEAIHNLITKAPNYWDFLGNDLQEKLKKKLAENPIQKPNDLGGAKEKKWP